MSTPAFASVVVCTRNRSRTLARCCAAALADFPADRWELLDVDNGSTDDTPRVVAAAAWPPPAQVAGGATGPTA